MRLTPFTKRALTAGAIGLAAAGIVTASAATLTVNSDGLGAGDTVVSSCDTAVDILYSTAYSTTTGTYQVNGVTITGIDGCDTRNVSVTLRDAANASLGSGSATVSGNTGASVSIPLTASAASVTGAAVVIG